MACKLGDILVKPSEDKDGKPLYGSWTHEQFAAEEEDEDDDWTPMKNIQDDGQMDFHVI